MGPRACWRNCRLHGHEFVRRFLQHVLPKGFHNELRVCVARSRHTNPVGLNALGLGTMEFSASGSVSGAWIGGRSRRWRAGASASSNKCRHPLAFPSATDPPAAHAMIRRRAAGADITTQVGNHTFRATGITAYLKNGGTLENAAAMANHASTRTTQLYDRRREEMTMRWSGFRFEALGTSVLSLTTKGGPPGSAGMTVDV